MTDQGEDTVEVTKWLNNTISAIVAITFLLLAPSIDYILFCYAPCALLTTVFIVFRYSLSKKQIVSSSSVVIGAIVFWYIFQKRELKRFYEQ